METNKELPKTLENEDIELIIDLRKKYETEQKDYLNLSFQYLNFYTGLLIAILGATIAGLVQTQSGNVRDLVLIAGPVIVILLGILGYENVRVFFTRFIEAWVTLRNIEEILGEKYQATANIVNNRIIFKSKYGGFIAHYERKQIEDIITDSKTEGINAEELISRITKAGDTLLFAKLTFVSFIIIGVILASAIVLSYLKII